MFGRLREKLVRWFERRREDRGLTEDPVIEPPASQGRHDGWSEIRPREPGEVTDPGPVIV
ncbi:MAG: hypothetical protein VYE22_24935 [Myxococcota bacterium]|nr:hypothetical protein [Myxococcota bacterium]